jgi:hypothetical protein
VVNVNFVEKVVGANVDEAKNKNFAFSFKSTVPSHANSLEV